MVRIPFRIRKGVSAWSGILSLDNLDKIVVVKECNHLLRSPIPEFYSPDMHFETGREPPSKRPQPQLICFSDKRLPHSEGIHATAGACFWRIKTLVTMLYKASQLLSFSTQTSHTHRAFAISSP
jgi:hypothetical protein